MRKKYLRVAAVCCALAYAAAIGSVFVRIWLSSKELEKTALLEFNALVEKANAAAALGFMDEPFREIIRDSVYRSKGLAAAIVTGPAGPEYAVERKAGYLDALEGVPRFRARIELSPDTLVAPLRVDNIRNATIQVARMQALPEGIFAALRDALLFTLVPLLVSLLLLFYSVSETGEDTAQFRNERGSDHVRPPVIDEEFDIPDLAGDVKPGQSEETNGPSGLFDTETGLGWEQYLNDRLEAELRRSASFEQDIVLLLFTIDTTTSTQSGLFRSFAEAIVSFFTFRDLAFRRGHSGAAVILPNVDLDHGIRMADEFMKKFRKALTPAEATSVPIYAGLSARSGRLVDAQRVVREAEGALKRAAEDPKAPIIAFKPDPERYRSFISSNKNPNLHTE